MEATDVEVGKDEIAFLFPGDGRLVVRKDGMLLRQKFPAGGVNRVLRLVDEKEMEEWSVEKYFGKFDPAKVKVKQVGGGQQGMGLLQGFYLTMIRGLAENGDAGERLDEQREEIVERMVPLYRPVARRVVKGNAKLMKLRIDLEIRFSTGWEEAQRRFPEDTRKMTYEQFIESLREPYMSQLMESAAPGVGAMMPPVLDPEVRAELEVKELVIADQLRELGAQAMAKAVFVELFEAAAANEKKRGLE